MNTNTAQTTSLIQENKELKEKLHDKELIFNNILETTLAGYWDWKVAENISYLSPTFKSMFGYEDHEMENSAEAWQKIVHPDDLHKVFETYEKHISSRGEIPYIVECRFFHKNGSIVWVYCKGKAIEWDENWNPIRMVGCHIDITEKKENEEKEKYTLKLETKNKELEQFAYVASHDLQEPLKTVQSFVDLINTEHKDEFKDETYKYLEFINDASSRMNQLVQGLLDYSRLGKDIEAETTDCNVIVTNTLEDLRASINNINAQITITKLPTLKVYPTELRLLFQNLISNALKFSKNESTCKIEIGYELTKNTHQFYVKDNGIGIEEKYIKKIFKIFQRLHNMDLYDGTGIGLAKAQKIVDLHEGDIWAESTYGEGSTFYFTLGNL